MMADERGPENDRLAELIGNRSSMTPGMRQAISRRYQGRDDRFFVSRNYPKLFETKPDAAFRQLKETCEEAMSGLNRGQ